MNDLSVWERQTIELCKCNDLINSHVHCPCINCNNRAVSRRTELRHWNDFVALAKNATQVEGSTEGFDDQINISLTQCTDLNSISGEESGGSGGSINNCSNNFGGSNDSISMFSSGSDLSSFEMSEYSECSGDDDINNSSSVELILPMVVKILDLAGQMKASLNNTEILLKLIKTMLSEFRQVSPEDARLILEQWPNSMAAADSLLISSGYTAPKTSNICFDRSHQLHWYEINKNETCPDCDQVPSIQRYYMSLKDKIKKWFKSTTKCHNMLEHWRQKDRWINGPLANEQEHKREIWDGSRFKELAWFWDPNSKWVLPHKCSHCEKYGKLNENECYMDKVKYTCEHCNYKEDIVPQWCHGDPRNLGLIGHFDGWQPGFGKINSHGSGSVEVGIANIEKAKRNKTEEVYVVEFVPEHAIPNKQPNALDPFIEPLVAELETLFVEGLTIDFPIDYDKDIRKGRCTIRCLLILWTGDYPAQCEIGKFSCKGTFGCRLDYCKGVSVKGSSTKYYTGNRFHARYPWEERDFIKELHLMEGVEYLTSVNAKLREAKKTGYTGLTILSRLNTLYSFNPLKDMVRDVMHLVPMNCVKKLFKTLIEEEYVDINDIDKQLKIFPFTSEQLDGRCPTNILRYKMWSAEEWAKFSYPVAEIIFRDLVTEKIFHLIWLTAKITQFLFHGRSGLNATQLDCLRRLCWRRAVLMEEWIGEKQCVITSHETLHIVEDIERFGHSDNFWCFHFERAVRRYKNTETNFKNIELTYAKMELRRETLQAIGMLKPFKETSRIDHQLSISSSIVGASQLQNRPCVLVGKGKVSAVDGDIMNLLETLGKQPLEWCLRNLRSCVFPGGDKVSIGSNVLVEHQGEELIGKVQEFLVVKTNSNEPMHLVQLKLWSFSSISDGNSFFSEDGHIMLMLVADILRTVIMVEIVDSDDFLLMDHNRPLPDDLNVLVPIHPEIDDIVVVEDEEEFAGKVVEIMPNERRVRLQMYKRTESDNLVDLCEMVECSFDDLVDFL